MTTKINGGYGSNLVISGYLLQSGYSDSAPPLDTGAPAVVWLRVVGTAFTATWGHAGDRWQLTVGFNGGTYDSGVQEHDPAGAVWSTGQIFDPVADLLGDNAQLLSNLGVYPITAHFKVWNSTIGIGAPLLDITGHEDVTIDGVGLTLVARIGASTYTFS